MTTEQTKRAQHEQGVYRSPVSREVLSIADEMHRVAGARRRHDADTSTADMLDSWASRIERALINGETMEGAMSAAIAKAVGTPS